jgi:hypothetical protein
MRRRELLASGPLSILGARLACARVSEQQATHGSNLKEELSSEELEIIAKSAMAKDVDTFFGKGFS